MVSVDLVIMKTMTFFVFSQARSLWWVSTRRDAKLTNLYSPKVQHETLTHKGEFIVA